MRIRKRIHQRGFTLVEFIVVIVVIAALFGTGGLALGRAFESYALTKTTSDVDWQARVALERMVRDLRDIRTASVADLDISSGTQVWFVDASGNGVCFYRDAGTNRLMRSSAASAATCSAVGSNPQPLASNISAVNFYYYTNVGGTPASAAQVYYIATAIAVTAGGINESFRATLVPRRF